MIIRLIIILLLVHSHAFAGQGMGPGPGISRVISGGGQEIIGDNTIGTTLGSSWNNTGTISFWPIDGTFSTNHNSVITYTFSGRATSGSREVRAALFTESSGTYTFVSGSDTGGIYYTCVAEKDDVTIQSQSTVSVVAGVQYYVAFTWAGFGSMYTGTDSTSGKSLSSAMVITDASFPSPITPNTVISNISPKKLLVGAQ